MWLLLFAAFTLPLYTVYRAVAATKRRVQVRTGVGVEGAMMERVLRGCSTDRVTACSGFVPSVSMQDVPVQGLLCVVRYLGRLTGRYDVSDAFMALQMDAALEPLAQVAERMRGKGDESEVTREDVQYVVNLTLSLYAPGCFGYLLGQSERTVVDDCYEGAVEWVFGHRGYKDLDLLEELGDIVWVRALRSNAARLRGGPSSAVDDAPLGPDDGGH